MLKHFFAEPKHRTLTLLFAATFIELTGYFMLSPLLTLSLHVDGVSQSVIGVFAAMSWLALLAGAPYAATLVARLGAQTTLRLCAVLPLLSASAYLSTTLLPVWFVVAFVGSLASSLRWICSEATVAALSTDVTRGRWVSGYSTLIGLTFIFGPALVSALIARQELGAGMGAVTVSHAPWWLATGLIALGAALTFAVRLPAALQQTSPAPRAPIERLMAAARQMPLAVVAGMLGGFFEVGINGVLPLYGLQLGLSQASATLLVSVSAVGGIVGVLAAGWLGDGKGQLKAIRCCAAIIAGACTMQFTLTLMPTLVWGVAFGWGAAGAALYILVMVALGGQYEGVDLVQRMAVLVMAYTLGGLFAPLLGGWALQLGTPYFHAVTSLFAVAGVLILIKIKS